MTKEKVLSVLKDLILTLDSPNINVDEVVKKFHDKLKELQVIIVGLGGEDRRWVDEEYRKWGKELTASHKEKINPDTERMLKNLVDMF